MKASNMKSLEMTIIFSYFCFHAFHCLKAFVVVYYTLCISLVYKFITLVYKVLISPLDNPISGCSANQQTVAASVETVISVTWPVPGVQYTRLQRLA